MTHQGVVAAGHRETCRAAAVILEEGGNAVDAALAAVCVACVAEPVLASLGGGGFLMTMMADGRHAGTNIVHDFFVDTPGRRPDPAAVLDFRPVHADFGTTQQEFHVGMASIAVPGLVAGLFAAHADLGRMPLKRIVEPAIQLAKAGVAVDPVQASIIDIAAALLKAGESSRRLFASEADPTRLIAAGEQMRIPAFAEILELLAIEGADLFYRGEIARQIVADMRAGGGLLTMADLAGYRVHRRPPLCVHAFGAEVLLNPPPASGGVLLAFALALIDETAAGQERPDGAEYLERLACVIEATHRIRGEIAIEDGDTAVKRLLAPALISRFRAEIARHPAATRGTTHISVIDRAGNAAALSMTNGEGSSYAVPDTDIILNNMLGEQDLNPGGFQSWEPAVRMTSMMAPTLVRPHDGGLIALGSGGSNRIRSAILQVLLNRLLFGMPAREAVDRPRIHYENGTLSIEAGFAERDVVALAGAFAKMQPWGAKNMFFGGVHVAERRPTGDVCGAGDARRGGAVLTVTDRRRRTATDNEDHRG